ncbi:MAG: GAF domain-containing protein, partial [Anaerolineales bacterium]|nr:GAF domain-containing protein [Anaerolineales bacterium]
MRSFPLRRDLGLQLLALWLLFVLLVIVAVFVFEFVASRRLEADIKAADLALARAVAQETDAVMSNALSAVQQLGTFPAVQSADLAEMDTLFGILFTARSDVNLIYRLDAQGTMLYHYPVAPGSTVGNDFSFRDYFQAALTSYAPLVSKGRISPTTNEPVATAVMPLWSPDNDFLGVVGTNLKLQALSNSLANIARDYRPEEQFQISILDASGQIIAHPQPDRLLQDASAALPGVFAALQAGQSGNLIAADEASAEMLYSYVPISSVGWGVVVTRPTAVAFATPTAFRRGAIATVVLFLLGGVVFWLILSRRVVRPLEQLATFSQEIGQTTDAATAHQPLLRSLTERPDQMGHLTRSLRRMQEAIEARLNELSTLLKTSTAVVSSLETDVVLNSILEQVESLLNVQMCAIFAYDEQKGNFRVTASLGLPDWYAETVIVDPNDPSSVTMRAIHSGQPVQISDTETNPSFVARRQRAKVSGYRAMLAVPLNTHHAPPSALLAFRPDPHVFTDREINLLFNFANQAAMAIENATLYARSDMQLQEQTRRLEALIQSMQDGLILEDLQGKVLYANRRLAMWANLAMEAIPGLPVVEVMDRLLQRVEERARVETAVASILSGHANRQTEFALDSDEGRRYLRLTLFEVTDSQQTPIGRGRILQDITQRHELDRMKSSLISTVSHELRTPLAAIKGYATTLLADDVEWDSQSQREFLGIISLETDHLTRLVSDLLDMSRIEAGNLTVSKLACDLDVLIQEAVQHAHSQPADRLKLDIPPDLPPLFVDPQRITAVLRNLIENAAKYSPPDSLIH